MGPSPTTDTSSSPPLPVGAGGGNAFATLPPGWTTVTDPNDGRLFYWHAATNRASWAHPQYHLQQQQQQYASDTHNNSDAMPPRDRPPQPPSFDYVPAPSHQKHRGYFSSPSTTAPPLLVHTEENPYMASRRPDNHQCGAIAALVLPDSIPMPSFMHDNHPNLVVGVFFSGPPFGSVGSSFDVDGGNGNGQIGIFSETNISHSGRTE
eukprot:scaffold1510_cov163-Amphora_coffeaeformis.AAC.7